MQQVPHIPVMPTEFVQGLAPVDDGLYVDGTFGGGSHTELLLCAADCAVIAIDRDPDAVRGAQALLKRWSGKLTVVHSAFSAMADLTQVKQAGKVDGVGLDLGVSSMQLDQAERGFSFMRAGRLDMRMSQSGQSAEEIVNSFDESDLAKIIGVYGEEKKARRIAAAIIAKRNEKRIETTDELASLVESLFPRRPGKSQIHPATRTFQGLRIFVNDEVGELVRGLIAAEKILKPGGRLAILTFQSLDDRVVKQFLRERAGKLPGPSRYVPEDSSQPAPSFAIVGREVRKPSSEEIQNNPRSRSAKLRVAERTHNPPWTEQQSQFQTGAPLIEKVL